MSCLTHAQLKLLDIYPKFTDGEPVLPGDEFADNGRLHKLSRVEIARLKAHVRALELISGA